jgi:hypothetical protein
VEQPNTKVTKVIKIGIKYKTYQEKGTLKQTIIKITIPKEIIILKPFTQMRSNIKIYLGMYTLETTDLFALISLTLWLTVRLKNSHILRPIKMKIGKKGSLE